MNAEVYGPFRTFQHTFQRTLLPRRQRDLLPAEHAAPISLV
jgi:hypothetical protein